jgi:hypothetical protein
MPNYVANPFAAAQPGAKSGAYANALRSYAPNQFAGSASPQGPMAPHLSQPIPLDADLVSAYKALQTDPQAQQYSQSGLDLQKLWRQSPNAPIFKPGYQHNPYAMQRAGQIGRDREQQQMLAALSPEERAMYAQAQQLQGYNEGYRGE